MAGSINKPKKPSSKRGTSRLRFKIGKASLAKQRKDRRAAKKNPEWRSKLKKDPGIPNLFPYKEKLLEEIEEHRMKKAEAAKRRKEMAKAASTGIAEEAADEEAMEDVEGDEDGEDFMDDDDDDDDDDESNPMAALKAAALKAAAKYEKELGDDNMGGDYEEDDEDDAMETNEMSVGQASSRKTYDKVFKKVVDEADVVLYVLDARDPEGTRSREVERSIMAAAASSGKRLILVLNKIDLVPPQVLRDWLVYLRRYFPTLPLRAAGPAPNAHTFHHRDLTVQGTSATLLRALKSFAASRDLKRAVSVGVIGYPNVGKSSVINALLGRLSGKAPSSSRACPAGAEAGVTTSIRAVKLDSKLTLLDSPGVVFPGSASVQSAGLVSLKNAAEAHAHLVLLNAVPPKQIDDPIPAVALLLRRLAAASPALLQKLTDVYDVPALLPSSLDGDVSTDFLVQVARKRGRLSRGGIPNLTSAAMTVVTDWRDGRIQGWVEAPVLAVESGAASTKKRPATKSAASRKGVEDEVVPDQKKIVTQWAAEFKLEGLWGDDGAAVDDDDDAMKQ